MGQLTRFHTRALSSELQINAADNAILISGVVQSGTCTVLGSAKFKGVDSDAITLSEGETFNLTSENQGAPIDGVTITPSGGTTNLLIKV